MRRASAIVEITKAGGTPVEQGAFLRYRIPGDSTAHSFFPNHYENMRNGEVARVVGSKIIAAMATPSTRRRPRD